MNKQDAMTEIETIRARLTVLEKIVQEEGKPQGLWIPEDDQDYWYIKPRGVDTMTFDDDSTDKSYIAHGNCFPTREAAEKAAPLFARAHKIIQAALMADPDAGLHSDSRQWTVWKTTNKWIPDCYTNNQEVSAYVHTGKQAEHMAAILNAEGV